MMPVSLGQQIDEVIYELGQRRSVYPRLVASGKQRQSVVDYRMARMEAVRGTLEWLFAHEAEIKAFLALPAESRATILEHPENVLLVQGQVAAAERRAAQGGPVR